MSTAYKKLGFSQDEKNQIVDDLNILLANYQIHYQKLRNFHWNVKGPDFFDIHEQFEMEYNHVKLCIDEFAERIRTFGATPYSTLEKYLDVAEIEESESDISGSEMVSRVLNDFTILMGLLITASETSHNIGDLGTTDMLVKELKRMEKRHWMFTSFNSK